MHNTGTPHARDVPFSYPFTLDIQTTCQTHPNPHGALHWALNDTYRSDKFAPKVKCPVTIIAATHDSVVPIAHARKLAASFGRSVKWVEFPCGHNGLWKQKGFLPVYGKACALPK